LSPDRERIKAVVFGGSGYVAGELLRLLARHPRFEVAAAFSTSQAGEPVCSVFPNLAGCGLDRLTFTSQDAWEGVVRGKEPLGLFFATPHGVTAALVDRVLSAAERSGTPVRVVDLSADFRLADPAAYARAYGHPHGAPARLAQFTCAVPEHRSGKPAGHVAHPGCFTTAVVVAAYPFVALDLVKGPVFVSATTGSSGSGRAPASNTHHPERSGNLYAYGVLAHRHEPEMAQLLAAARPGAGPEIEFVPQSGPFVRGIHATLRLELAEPREAAALVAAVNGHYGEGSFVHATETAPKLSEVVGTNRVRLGVFTRGRTLVVTSVVDNLTKGAAGGAVQWMNRLFDLDDDAGLRLPGLLPA
jgi:N-acetyl-gamma-glutamyl-phosphate reductase